MFILYKLLPTQLQNTWSLDESSTLWWSCVAGSTGTLKSATESSISDVGMHAQNCKWPLFAESEMTPCKLFSAIYCAGFDLSVFAEISVGRMHFEKFLYKVSWVVYT